MNDSNWQPGASIDTLRARAVLYQYIRQFFQLRNVLEVDVPIYACAAPTDPFIQAVATTICGESYLLQSSPEFYMKRLLAFGSGDIFSLGKAFRDEEAGRKHNPEFTMLEWYRVGFTEQQLIEEVIEFITDYLSQLNPLITADVTTISYAQLFQDKLGINPHQSSTAQLQKIALQHIDTSIDDDNIDVWLDLLMTHVIEPQLQGLTVIHDYPATQAALAKITRNAAGDFVARRFEVYFNSMELGNGYWELTDAQEQQQRFQRDLDLRKKLNLPQPPIDKKLLAAMQSGLPACAGVAIGVDRLLMCSTRAHHIDDVLSFSLKRS